VTDFLQMKIQSHFVSDRYKTMKNSVLNITQKDGQVVESS
jgi:hypothetical protein